MSIKQSLSLFLRRLTENDKLRFLFFVERNPKHSVAGSGFNIHHLAIFSVVTGLAGFLSFCLFDKIGLFGIVGLMGVIMIVALEILHIAYDR